MDFNVGDKVKSILGATGVVEQIGVSKNGEKLIYVRWKSGSAGAYNGEEVARYGIVKQQA